MYFNRSFSLLLVLTLFQTLITSTNGLLLALTVFVVTFGFISFVIRKLIENDTKSSDYYSNHSLLLILILNARKGIVGLLTNFNLSNQRKNINSLTKNQSFRTNEFCGNRFDIRHESKTFAKLITDNYIEFWYKTISEENNEFITDCETILQKILINFFEKCEQKLNTEKVLQKSLTLLEKHLINNRLETILQSKQQINTNLVNETERVALIIERVLRLLAPEEVLCVIRNESLHSDNKFVSKGSHYLSLFIMIEDMLTQSVFIPITNIITDPKWIYSNIIQLCDLSNSYNKLNSSNDNKIDNRSEDKDQSSKLNEPTLEESEEANTLLFSQRNCLQYNMKLISDLSVNSLPEINVDLVEQISHSDSYNNVDLCLSNEETDNSRVDYLSDLSGNESNDEFVVEALEEEDIDLKLFTNLVIPKTQETKNAANASYVLYCIEYDALFQEVDESVSPFNSNPYLVRKTVTVYRRFSEFITLQKVLEQNKHIKKLLKGIKKPSSIQITAQNLLIFAGSSNVKLDSSTIEFRRIFLQTFLQELCKRELIVRLAEFQQFLAYGRDARIAFVNSRSHNILPLNIDKVIYKGVKGAISIIKTALPIEPQVGKIDPSSCDRIYENEKLTVKQILTKVENNNTMQLEKKLDKWKENKCDSTLINFSYSSGEATLTNSSLSDHFSHNYGISQLLGPRSRGDGCEANDMIGFDSSEFPEQSTKNKIEVTDQNKSSLSSQLINCVVLFLTNNVIYVWQSLSTKLIELVFGAMIEKLIGEWLEEVVTKELFLKHIHRLHLALWPLSSNDNYYDTSDATLEESINAVNTYIRYRVSLLNPCLSYIMQKFSTRKLLSNILLNLDCQEANKVCFYSFIEMILSEIE